MTSRIAMIGLAAAGLVALAGCEKPQGMGGSKSDTAPYQGTGAAAFTISGWKSGDKTSWEQQLKTRAQAQNDHAKAQ